MNFRGAVGREEEGCQDERRRFCDAGTGRSGILEAEGRAGMVRCGASWGADPGWQTDADVYECLNEHWFRSLAEARAIVAAWRMDYKQARPHSALEHRTPAEFAADWRSRHGASAQARYIRRGSMLK